jgi:hypothetical protein
MDIEVEFGEWAKYKGHEITDSNYYDLWALFLDDNYNDQRKEIAIW